MFSSAAILRDAPSALLRLRVFCVETGKALIPMRDRKHRVAKDAAPIAELCQ